MSAFTGPWHVVGRACWVPSDPKQQWASKPQIVQTQQAVGRQHHTGPHACPCQQLLPPCPQQGPGPASLQAAAAAVAAAPAAAGASAAEGQAGDHPIAAHTGLPGQQHPHQQASCPHSQSLQTHTSGSEPSVPSGRQQACITLCQTVSYRCRGVWCPAAAYSASPGRPTGQLKSCRGDSEHAGCRRSCCQLNSLTTDREQASRAAGDRYRHATGYLAGDGQCQAVRQVTWLAMGSVRPSGSSPDCPYPMGRCTCIMPPDPPPPPGIPAW